MQGFIWKMYFLINNFDILDLLEMLLTKLVNRKAPGQDEDVLPIDEKDSMYQKSLSQQKTEVKSFQFDKNAWGEDETLAKWFCK